MTPSASVIIPAFNSEQTLALTIESALAQDWQKGHEVIVVDNGSTDNTAAIAGRYPVRLVAEPKRGRSAARNRGRTEARGQLLGFADSDCDLPPNWLSAGASLLKQEWVGAVQARIQKRGARETPRDFVHARWHLPFLDTCALVTTAEAFDNAEGFDEELKRNVDMDFSFRLLACGYALALTPDCVAIKHHDLSSRQVLRRGWDGGQSVALVDRRWEELAPPARRRLGQMAKTWVASVLRARRAPQPHFEALEQTVKFCAYVATLPHKLPRNTRRRATNLPERLGRDRYLVVTPSGGFLYDQPGARVSRLSPERIAELARNALRKNPTGGDLKNSEAAELDGTPNGG